MQQAKFAISSFQLIREIGSAEREMDDPGRASDFNGVQDP